MSGSPNATPSGSQGPSGSPLSGPAQPDSVLASPMPSAASGDSVAAIIAETPATRTAAQRQRRTAQARDDIRDFVIKLVVAGVIAWLLFGVMFGVTIMEGESMYPRIRDGDLMVYYRLQRDYAVGDVVTFKRDDMRYTSRIVALSGDTVDINENGELLVNGNVQSEEIFYPTQAVDGKTAFPYDVPADSVFLLSDFRTNATDSRNYGAVAIQDLDGKIISTLRRRGI